MNYNEELSDIHADLLNEMPDKYSKIKGTWLWEMFKVFALKIYELLSLLTDTAGKLNVENLQGDELEAYVRQWTDLKRKSAQKAEGYLNITGNGMVYADTIVSTESGIQFTTIEDTLINGTVSVPIKAVSAGENGNVEANSITVLVTSNAYITSITNTEPTTRGTDEETDNALRDRYYLRLQMPATSGNKAHYILWALECNGVGGAKASRDNSINNKVNLYICGDKGEAVDDSVISSVQTYIDPNKNGDGSGVAPIGAICEVFGAREKTLKISGIVELDNTLDKNAVLENIYSALTAYLSKINFNVSEASYAKLLNGALGCNGVNDITDFKVNGGYANITCAENEIFTINSFEMEVE
ncbi:MAG: baseplate J/gp47 family protein [Clostridia bacterium]|nr:baseplate J/gp47 family protein [Clostridia bacterium]